MCILTRYIIFEHIGPFFLGITSIVFLFLLNIVFRDLGRLLGKGLSFWTIVKFFGLNLAWILALAIPMAVLMATLMAFGRLSSDREIDAMKASGVSIHQLVRPIFIGAILLMIAMMIFNNTILPEFNYQVKKLYFEISKTRPAISLEPNVFYDEIPNYTIYVQKVRSKKGELEKIFIRDGSDPRFNKTIVADRGTLLFSKARQRIVFTLYDGEIHEVEKQHLEKYRRMKFKKQIISISVSDAQSHPFRQRGDREKSTRMLLDDIAEDKKRLHEREMYVRRMISQDIGSLFPPEGLPEEMGKNKNASLIPPSDLIRPAWMLSQLEGEMAVIQAYKRSIASLWVEVHKKYSIPVACLVFVLVGAPLGILVRQSGFTVAGWVSIVFFLIYWTFLIGGEQLADRLLVSPAVAMWSPNVIVGILGIFLYYRTLKESTLFPSWRFVKSQKNRSL